MRMKINEAIIACRERGVKVWKKDLAELLWPGSEPSVRSVSLTKLCNGDLATIRPEWIEIICEACQCTPEFLLDFKNNQE